MKRLDASKRRLRAGAGLALLAAGLYAASLVLVAGADPKPETMTQTKTRTGADLYAMHCARCHIERYPTERTDAQWKTIMLHMRTRAQIPANDARKILGYLQESN